MASEGPLIALVAGEASGDNLGAALIAALRERVAEIETAIAAELKSLQDAQASSAAVLTALAARAEEIARVAFVLIEAPAYVSNGGSLEEVKP